jgi:hypothetical protein
MIRTSGTLESLLLLLPTKLQTETNHAHYTTDFKQKLLYSKRVNMHKSASWFLYDLFSLRFIYLCFI